MTASESLKQGLCPERNTFIEKLGFEFLCRRPKRPFSILPESEVIP